MSDLQKVYADHTSLGGGEWVVDRLLSAEPCQPIEKVCVCESQKVGTLQISCFTYVAAVGELWSVVRFEQTSRWEECCGFKQDAL
jgi:hypothetical protein